MMDFAQHDHSGPWNACARRDTIRAANACRCVVDCCFDCLSTVSDCFSTDSDFC